MNSSIIKEIKQQKLKYVINYRVFYGEKNDILEREKNGQVMLVLIFTFLVHLFTWHGENNL